MDDQTLAEAKRWYARLPSPECTPAERATFERWRATHPDHATAFERIERLMGRVPELRDDPAIARAARAALRLTSGQLVRRPVRHPDWRLAAALSLAAGVVLAIGLAVFRAGWLGAPVVEHYATAVGEQREIQLADGTALLLDTGTRLDIRYTRRQRQVDFQRGRAQYTVTPDERRPFVVRAMGGAVTALGTQFQTDLRDGVLAVTLLEGSVTVERGSGASRRELTLEPGEQLTTNAAGTLWTKTSANLEAAGGWTRGKLVFDDEPLADAIDQVNRYSSTRLRITDPALQDLRISGTFDAQDQETLFLALEQIWSIRAHQTSPDEILLSRSDPSDP